MTNQIIAYYLIIINIVTFLVYGIDKWKARKAMWRVREASLFILAPLGFTRKDAWLCDLLPETRINAGQAKVIKEKYEPLMKEYGLNPVTIPPRPTLFCDQKRSEEILSEFEESQAGLLVLLGDIPIQQFLNRVTNVNYTTL